LPSLLAARRALAAVAARGELVVLIGSAAWLVPIQRRLAASSPCGVSEVCLACELRQCPVLGLGGRAS
jgi:hypothetical protein